MGHTLRFSGHMGIGATQTRIACHYFWPEMTMDIQHYVKSCPECRKVGTKHLTAPATIGEMPVTGTPFERVALT